MFISEANNMKNAFGDYLFASRFYNEKICTKSDKLSDYFIMNIVLFYVQKNDY